MEQNQLNYIAQAVEKVDDHNMEGVANELGVSQQALDITCRTLRSL